MLPQLINSMYPISIITLNYKHRSITPTYLIPIIIWVSMQDNPNAQPVADLMNPLLN